MNRWAAFEKGDPGAVLEGAAEYLRFLKECNCSGFDLPKRSIARVESWGKAGESLSAIRSEVLRCRGCPLHQQRNRPVFGAGNGTARLVFVGEAPGRDEDLAGEPFVGEAGKLLTKIIAAMNLTREDVYICNILKCRPPENRNPLPQEVRACSPFLRRQIASIGPDFICALGAFAAQTLLKTDTPISRLRGSFHTFRSGGRRISVMPTFHPAFLLHHPERKRDVWADIQKLMQAMEPH